MFRLIALVLIVTMTVLHSSNQVYAVTYPASTPFGETAGGTFQTYFDNMYVFPNCSTGGEVVGGFTSSGVPICVVPVSSGFFFTGQTNGDTVRFNGTEWVRSDFLYNNGVQIGIGTQAPQATLDISGNIRINNASVASGRFLVSDATGIASWTDNIPATSFSISGSVLGSTTYYNGGSWVATTNLFNTGGYVGIGTVSPQALLDVNGQIRMNHPSAASGRFLVSDANGIASWTDNIPATTFTISGQTLGATTYYNGTNWVATTNLYNTGGYVGIGTTSPQAPLDVNGQIRISGGSPGSGLVLTSDATGLASWQSPIVSGITGGQTNYIARWLTSTTLGTGSIYDNGTNVGIGTTNPQGKFEVWDGAMSLFHFRGGTNMGVGAYASNYLGTGMNNFGIGHLSLASRTTGSNNIALGGSALYSTTQGSYNIGIGENAVRSNTDGSENIGIGYSSLYNNTLGSSNIGIGVSTLANNTVGNDNVAVGNYVLTDNTTGNRNTAIGKNALRYNTGGFWNVAIGYSSMYSNISGSNNVAVGLNSLRNNTTGDSNTAIGSTALLNNTGGVLNTGIGWAALFSNTEGAYNTAIGGGALTSNTTGWDNTAVGLGALEFTATSNSNTAVGTRSLNSNTVGGDNTALGAYSLYANTLASYNTAIGKRALRYNVTGSNNTALGLSALENNTIGEYNVGVGLYALAGSTTGNGNVVVGSYSLNNTNTGSNNSALGNYAGFAWSTLTGSNNTFLGANTTYSINNLSNATAVGANVTLGQSDTVILGNNANVGIGTATPTAKLEVVGQIRINGGGIGSGRYLISDATGLASWTDVVTATTFMLSGQTLGATPYYNGTSWVASTNIFNTGGNIGVGTNMPTSKLEVVGGDARINGLTVGRGSGNILTNVAIGPNALYSNAAGAGTSIAIGQNALYAINGGQSNIGIGVNALYTSTNAINVIAIGQAALELHPGGRDNIAMGRTALSLMTTGDNNTAIGVEALRFITGGTNNTAIGRAAATLLTEGSNNIAIGSNSQLPSSTGSNQLSIGNWIYGDAGNIGIGTGTALTARLSVNGQVRITGGSPGLGRILTSDASGLATWTTGFSGTTTASGITGGTQNYVPKFGTGGTGLILSQIYDTGTGVGIGVTTPGSKFEVWSGTVTLFHMRGTNNIGLGLASTRYQTSGTANVGVGNSSLRSLTTGYSNTAVGDSAGYNVTTGYFNSSLGAQALYSNNIGTWNVALGMQSLWTNLSGNYNIGIGGQALYLNSANSNNIAIGYQALRASTADNNVAIGHSAGSGITTGSNNILIGANIAPQLGNTSSNQLNIGNWIYGNNGAISLGRNTMSSGGYRLDVANGYVNSASGYCINGTCIPNWSGIFDAINGSGNYLPKWNQSGTGLIASRISDNGTDIAISSGALQQVTITPANQADYQQVIISTGGVLKKGLTTREKLRIFAVSDYGANDDTVTIQQLCFDTSTNSACRTTASDNPLSNVPNFNSVDSKSYTGGIGEYFPATATRPPMFVSYYTGTYMIVNSYTFHNTSFSTSDLGCNVFPYYSLYSSSGSIPNLAKYDATAPVVFTIKNDTAISNVYSSTNLSLPTQKTTRVGSQFISNVFMTPGQALLMTIGVQSCATRADRSMALVVNNQKKMTLSITEL